MIVCVVDEDRKNQTNAGPWCEYKQGAYDYLVSKTDTNSVTFCHHFKELSVEDDELGRPGHLNGYQVLDVFKKQVALASEKFKDMDFQFITFNEREETKFGGSMKELGFEKMGESLGRSNTPITLYIKTKRK